MTGAEGLEPPDNGAKNRRLTTWLCPKLQYIMKGGDEKVNMFPLESKNGVYSSQKINTYPTPDSYNTFLLSYQLALRTPGSKHWCAISRNT